MPIDVRVAQGSLTDGQEAVLVNASNTQAWLGSGVSGAIARACGEGFQQKLTAALNAKFGKEMAPGEVLLTDAGSHPRAKLVAHVAVMDYRGGTNGSPTLDTLRTGCERLWDVLEGAPGREALSVAMVALGAGVGGLGVVDSTRIACETLKAHEAIHRRGRVERVVFYGFTPREFSALAAEVGRHFPSALDALAPELRAKVSAGQT